MSHDRLRLRDQICGQSAGSYRIISLVALTTLIQTLIKRHFLPHKICSCYHIKHRVLIKQQILRWNSHWSGPRGIIQLCLYYNKGMIGPWHAVVRPCAVRNGCNHTLILCILSSELSPEVLDGCVTWNLTPIFNYWAPVVTPNDYVSSDDLGYCRLDYTWRMVSSECGIISSITMPLHKNDDVARNDKIMSNNYNSVTACNVGNAWYSYATVVI